MGPGGSELAAKEVGGPQGVVGLQQKVRVLQALGEAEELLPHVQHRVIFSTVAIHHPESPQHTEPLQRLPYPLTQLVGMSIQPFHFWGRLALGGP